MEGSYVALITPFRHNHLDEKAFCQMIEWHETQGSQGLVVAGCTGEGLALTPVEVGQLVKWGAQRVSRLELWAGVGGITTHEAIERAHQAEKNGAVGLMVYAPPYIKPSQDHLVRYFTAIHEATSVPLVLYNNPSRAGINLQAETIQTLANLPRVTGLKEASSDLTRPTALKSLLPTHFKFLAGEDHTIPSFLAQGGHGWISVIGNIFPQACADLYKAWKEGNITTFENLRDFLFPLTQLLGQETNPMPIKHAMAVWGWCLPEWRPPLGPVSSSLGALIEKAIGKHQPRQAHA